MSARNDDFDQIIILNDPENEDNTTCRRYHNLRHYHDSHRVICKNGISQIYLTSIRPLLGPIYIKDFANTLINCSWKWTLAILCLAFFSTWLVFACIWMIIAKSNGDLDGNAEMCLTGIESFYGYLLFSVETQTTIGYGNRSITDNCFEAVLVLCFQMLTSIAICSAVISIFYEKISGPGRVNSLNSFSKQATICQRDGELCLIFRVRDSDRRYQCNNDIKAYVVQKRGQDFCLKSLKLENIGILLWPIEIVHKIDKNSPLWDVSPQNLLEKRLEIVVTMEGICLSTSNASNIKTSYMSREILWGHTFENCVKFSKQDNCYIVNNKLFNKTKQVPTPLCSARRLHEIVNEIVNIYHNNDMSNYSDSITRKTMSYMDEDSGIASVTLSPVTVHNSSTPSERSHLRMNNTILDEVSETSSDNEDIVKEEQNLRTTRLISFPTTYNGENNYLETSF